MLNGSAKTPHATFFYPGGNDLKAVRAGKWKLHVNKGKPTALYDLETDIGETKEMRAAQPAITERLTGYVAEFAKDIAGHSRPAAFAEHPKPLPK
ncbi:MAG: hypothetical protein ABMA13_07070 [Chthoniobacteraceae bacterium]